MQNNVLTTGVILFFCLFTLPLSYGNVLKEISSQKNYNEVSKNLSSELSLLHKNSVKNLYARVCLDEVAKIIVDKPNNKMILYDINGCPIKEYNVRLGASYGPKLFEGDKKTPEGTYFITNKYESQKYEKFLSISYPTKKQEQYAKSKGLSAGGAVGIHFFASEKTRGSLGCITVKTKEEINEIYSLVKVGTEIKILPDNKQR